MREILHQATAKQAVCAETEYRLCGVKWYGEGVFERETCRGSELSATYLHPLKQGQLIYNRLFAWKASFALVQPEQDGLFVSNEFPRFEVDLNQALPEYVRLYCLSEKFVDAVTKASEGSAAVSRNRFKEDSFLSFEIPLPPLEAQRTIVDRWQSSIDKANDAKKKAAQLESAARIDFLNALGLKPQKEATSRRAFALNWSNMARWGSESNLRANCLETSSSLYPLVTGIDIFSEVMHGCSASPSALPTGLEVLKISAVTKGWLDISEKKFAPDSAKLRKQYALKKDDLLTCRTNGTLAYVGRAALVSETLDNLIFPDKVIRIRVKQNIDPAYCWHVLGTPFLRGQIESFARTAVGNYAIGGKDFWNLRLPLPPLDIQKSLVRTLEASREKSTTQLTLARQLRETAKHETEAALLGQTPPEVEAA